MNKKIAVIDIGSHSSKLEIFNLKENILSRYLKLNNYLYLYQDINTNGLISNNSINKLVNIILDYKKEINNAKCDKTIVLATSALRDAKNNLEVCQLIKEKTSLDITIIPGEKEACFSQQAFFSLNIKKEDVIFFDLGGGSTEISIINKKEVINSHSFPFGVIRSLKDDYKKELNNMYTFISPLIKNKDVYCYGCGSSIRRFALLLNSKKTKRGYKILKNDVLNFKNGLENNPKDYILNNYNLNGLEYEYLPIIIDLILCFCEIINKDYIKYVSISLRLGAVKALIK